ncbi:DciA family protein [Puerhibacterium sp. TATVAM-FAB25]
MRAEPGADVPGPDVPDGGTPPADGAASAGSPAEPAGSPGSAGPVGSADSPGVAPLEDPDAAPPTPPAEVARAALNRAKAAARARGLRPGSPPRRSPLAEPRTGSGSGPGARDPQLLSDVLGRLLREKGWTADVSVGGVIGRWREVVGDQVADHCAPETFEDKVLVVRADSTAWATQVRLLVPTLLRRLAEEVGEGVVDEVKVLGPAGPSFRRGPRSVRGQGPRDTWG